MITGLNSKLVEEKFTIDIVEVKDEGGQTVATGQAQTQGQVVLETSFTLDAILPLSPEELSKLTSQEETPEEGE